MSLDDITVETKPQPTIILPNDLTVSKERGPLWMPAGSVRALITFALVAVFSVCTYQGKDVNGLGELTFLMVGIYAGNRGAASSLSQ